MPFVNTPSSDDDYCTVVPDDEQRLPNLSIDDTPKEAEYLLRRINFNPESCKLALNISMATTDSQNFENLCNYLGEKYEYPLHDEALSFKYTKGTFSVKIGQYDTQTLRFKGRPRLTLLLDYTDEVPPSGTNFVGPLVTLLRGLTTFCLHTKTLVIDGIVLSAYLPSLCCCDINSNEVSNEACPIGHILDLFDLATTLVVPIFSKDVLKTLKLHILMGPSFYPSGLLRLRRTLYGIMDDYDCRSLQVELARKPWPLHLKGTWRKVHGFPGRAKFLSEQCM